MTNNKTVSVELTRAEICDLIITCSVRQSEKDGKKWSVLYNKLVKQLKEFDAANGKKH